MFVCYQENTERELQEQRRAARERENVEKRRSLALCTGIEVERESDDLEHALQKSLNYTGGRRSLRRNIKSDNQQPPIDSVLKRQSLQNDTNTEETEQRLRKEGQCLRTDSACGLQRVSADTPDNIKSHSRLNTRRVPSDGALESDIMSQQQQAVNVLPLTGLSSNKVLKVEKRVQDASERLAQIVTDASEDTKKDKAVNERSVKDAVVQSERMPQTEAETDSILVGETWMSSSPAETSPTLIENLETEHVYPRVGEVLECHTLVRALRSYESLSPAVVRPATNHCSKWKKEREAEERDGTSSPHAKEDSRLVKTPTRVPTKRALVPRGGPSNSSGIPRVRTKAEPTPSSGLSASHATRILPTRSASVRSTQVTSVQNELKRNAGPRPKMNVQSDTKQKRNASDAVNQDKSKGHEHFVRGSLLRVSKRYAPNSEPQTPNTLHSPTAATTAKTIRTAVINAAKAKTAKRPSPKTPRPASQPMWR